MNLPVSEWQEKRCVHYLSTRGPYGGGRKTKMYWHRRIAVYAVAALQIQRAWERHGWVDHLRSLEQADRERNAVLLQRAWRVSACKRFYEMFRKLMQCQGESLRSHLIQPPD